jgi:hypothetical protein
VFFGYTHCPDICPATTGTVGLAMDAFGPGVKAVFVSVDPERYTTEWLREYVRFLPVGFTALTGAPDRIRATADAWGVRYARVETGDPEAYSMAHTAEVYLVDAAGYAGAFRSAPNRTLTSVPGRAPSAVVAVPPTATAPVASPSRLAHGERLAGRRSRTHLHVRLGGQSRPVIPTCQLAAPGSTIRAPPERAAIGTTGAAVVRPDRDSVAAVDAVSHVASLAIPTPGAWRSRSALAAASLAGTASLTVLDPGTRPRRGAGDRSTRPSTTWAAISGGHHRSGARPAALAALHRRRPGRGPAVRRDRSDQVSSRRPAVGRSSWPATCSIGGATLHSSTWSRTASRCSATRRSSTAASTIRR